MKTNLLGDLLRSVSRSFYLTLRALPRGLREPIGLAYLLARTSDTIADSSEAVVALRLLKLRTFLNMIETGANADGLSSLRMEIVPADAAERELIARAGECLDALQACAEADRADIVQVLRTIIRGQELDLQRFGAATEITALHDARELEEYTYLVAGCVGEFWTQVCFRHLRNYARLDFDDMEKLGRSFGQGLQLVNILRDVPADLRMHRCYLPADELSTAGLAPDTILENPERARPVLEKWIARAEAHLADAQCYIENVRSWRLRFACLLPWAIGIRTLARLRAQPPLETAMRVKVSRAEVRRILRRAILAALPFGNLDAWRVELTNI